MKLNSELSCTGVSYPGRQKITEIFAELQRQARCYKDFVLPTSKLNLVLVEDGVALQFHTPATGKRGNVLPMSRRAILQLWSWIGLPLNSRLYKRLTTGYETGSGQHRDRFWPTLCKLVNDHLGILKVNKLIRTLQRPDGEWYIRAILSDRYRIIPNDQLFMSIADKLKQIKAEIWDARLSEDIFYLYAVAPGISAQVRADRTFEGDRWVGEEGDAVNAAFMLKNSETGQGGCEVCPAVVTTVKRSYMVRQNVLTLRHLGGTHAADEMLSASTIKDMNQIVYKQVRDYCSSTFDPDKFQEIIDKINDATQDELEDPVKAAEAMRIVFDLTEEREKSILRWLEQSGDKSRYGLAQAVAREAGENSKLRADEAATLEQASAKLIEDFTAVKLARAWKTKAESDANKAALRATKKQVKELAVPSNGSVGMGDVGF
jgi:hypothetical protein